MKNAKQIRELIAKYWGLVTQVDLSVGAILKTLDDLGLSDDTIVVYTSDHGDMMGSHQMVTKSVMYEEAVKVPWLMRIPQIGKGHVIKNRVSHIDLVPTLLELMGGGVKSLIPLITDGKIAEDYVFIEWNPKSGAIRIKEGGTNL
ncbi:TPA: hypothetical protein EYP66_23030, partial [Candidatus Poribacteria bacterium]|nr:hypothetical protein [Candidatus Poribacteria bacterium]